MAETNETATAPEQPATHAEPQDNPATEPEVPEAPAVKTFTQDELNEIVAKEKAKAARAAERKLRKEMEAMTNEQAPPKQEERASAPKQTPTPAPADGQAMAAVKELREELAFKDALSDLGVKLNARQKAALRREFDADEPEALEDAAKELGFIKPEPAQNAQQDRQPQAQQPTGAGPSHAQRPRYVDPGAPQGNPAIAQSNHPNDWTKDDIARMRADGTFLTELRKWRESLPGGSSGLFQKRNRALGR